MLRTFKAKYKESLNNSIIIRLALIATIFYVVYSFIYSYFEFKTGVYLMYIGGIVQLVLIVLFIFSIIPHRITALLGVLSTY